MSEACYIKDPKTGLFMGRKPGCSYAGEVSEQLLQKVEKDKGAIEQRVDAAAASGTLTPKSSELKDKAEQLARDVNSGKISYKEALYELSKGSAEPGRYAKAIYLLERDPFYWKSIAVKSGSEEVDTLMAGYAGAQVPGATDFALNLSDAKSGVQKPGDEEPRIPSGATKEQIEAHNKELARIAGEREIPEWHSTLVKRGVYDEKRYTNCHGNECDTQTSVYDSKFDKRKTSSGTIHDDLGYTAAMPPFYAGKLDRNKPLYVEVTNKANGKTVIVKVEDKGPFPIRDKEFPNAPKDIGNHHEDPTRGIDLSPAAYAKIAKNPGDGVFNVTVKFLSPEEGERRYKEQEKWAAEHRPEIEKSVQEARDALKKKSK
ncbi:septal ring lytic transglycosylase RlpA family protein [Candidatus Magnetominusculus dajiuhuensis]|uniref:septal ring lytic transglycosylase RlpA family protein n=1 Tax=Candidatus Magnetominusculus dajiuhuensis TaxID=3137712 RepID=UPI003B436060